MRFQKILKRLAIFLLVGCIIILAIDVLKTVKINLDYKNMQSSTRISSSSNIANIKYEPTDYTILNKADALEEIKKITLDLKEEYMNSEQKEQLFEIGNIHKIERLFYNYESYMVAKYKILNIIDELPKLTEKIKGYSNSQLSTYFENNSSYIDKYYGITTSDTFINFAKSLSFLDGTGIKRSVIDVDSVSFDYDNDILSFKLMIKADNDKIESYSVNIDYYDFSDNQVKPYVEITK